MLKINKIYSVPLLLNYFFLSTNTVLAQDILNQKRLPNPLSLEQALALSNSSHPDLSLADSELSLAQSQILKVRSRLGLNAYIEITPETVNPTTKNNYLNDSYARLFIGKTLTDFGLTQILETSAKERITSQKYVVLDAKLNHNINITKTFYSVLLADLRYKVDNEEVAQQFVRYNRLRDRYNIGQISELDLLTAENVYREVQNKRIISEKQQHATRQQLALALNRPTELPLELVWPIYQNKLLSVPDFAILYNTALNSNLNIQSLKYKVNSAKSEVKAKYAQRWPTLRGQLEFNEYSRNLHGRSNVRVGLSLRIPIYQAGEVNAVVKMSTSKMLIYESQLLQAKYQLRQICLELIQQLEALHVRKQTALQRLTYRDHYLDKQRALYELEIQSSLGNAMTKMTEAQWLAAKIDLDIALTWVQINAIQGKLIINNSEVRIQ